MEYGIYIGGDEIDPVISIEFEEEGVLIWNGFGSYEYSYKDFLAAAYYELQQ